MTVRPVVLPTVSHLKIRITGRTDLDGGRPESWLAPTFRFDAVIGFGEETWLPARSETVLAFHIFGAAVQCCFGRYAGRVSSRAANLALQPKGTPVQYRAEGGVRFAQVYLSDALLDRAAAVMSVPPLSGRLRDDLVHARDPVLHERLTSHVRRAFDTKHPADALEMEARALLVLDRLVTLHGGRAVAPMQGGLAPWQLRRTTEYLAARFAEEVTLAELAALADLSPFHFARAFKVSTGLPPHRYQTRLRFERARELLTATKLPIGEIAAAVGYDTPQSLARLFRLELSTTPSKYRRDG